MDPKAKKPANEIRVGFRTRVGNVISYAERLLHEHNFKTLHFSAVGGSIGTLVNAVEILKYTNAGLYQENKMATIAYQSVEEGGNVQRQRLYPKLEVTLSLEKPASQEEGYQEPMKEEDRKKLQEIREKNREERRNRGFRGGRGRGFRGRGMRRGFRGGRGFRGFRGRGMRRGFRAGFRGRGRPMGRGMRGGMRRGGFRGAPMPRGRGRQ